MFLTSSGNKEIQRVSQKKDEKMTEISRLKAQRNEQQRAYNAPKDYADTLKKCKIRVKETQVKLQQDSATEKKTKQFEYAKIFTQFLDAIESIVTAAQEYNDFSVDKAVTLQNKNLLYGEIRNLENAIAEKKNELEVYTR